MIRLVRKNFILLFEEKKEYHCIFINLYSPGTNANPSWFTEGLF